MIEGELKCSPLGIVFEEGTGPSDTARRHKALATSHYPPHEP